MLSLFILVQVTVTLKELGLDNPTGYPNVKPLYPGAGVCDPKELGLDNPTRYPNVYPIYSGAGVCDPEGAGSGQPYWLSQC